MVPMPSTPANDELADARVGEGAGQRAAAEGESLPERSGISAAAERPETLLSLASDMVSGPLAEPERLLMRLLRAISLV